MAIDLEVLAAGDAGFLLDDWAVEEIQTRGKCEADDAMTGFWSSLEGPDGGGGGGGGASEASAAWWEFPLNDDDNALRLKTTEKKQETDDVKLLLEEQEAALKAFAQPQTTLTDPAAISPVTIAAKRTRSNQETDSPFAAAARQMQVSEDSQTESGSDSNPKEPTTATMKTRKSSREEDAVVKSEKAAQEAPSSQATAKVARQRKRSSSAGKTRAAAVEPPLELAWDEKDLTPLEIRRKRNRESMQRARRRQRDDVEQMKGTLQQLEKHYQELNEKAQARRSRLSSGGSDSMELEANYYALADLSHTLKEEKFLLEQMLVDKQKTHRRLQQVMVDRRQELELACPLTTDDSTLFSDFEYLPMTEDQANEHIRRCYQQMRVMEETGKPLLSRHELTEVDDSESDSQDSPASPDSPDSSTSGAGCPFPPSATFGWDVRYETTSAGDFYVSFSKCFPGITAQQAMLSSWMRYAKPKSTPFRRMIRFEVLQVINDSTYLSGSDVEHPVQHDKVMRMLFLNFRMQTEKGFVIGRHSVNPTSPEVRGQAEQNSSFEYVDSSNWVEFSAHEDEETGEPGCRVKFLARTEYNTQEDMYVRLVNSISRTMLWELAVVPTAISLLPS
ncbi:hypothetical protein BBJ28_00025306 [Nothophytophthora sp. Chile5]|nr:hypothetical protein BBJ28_00025306 [Nothophytophthora sp. Chile5]